MSYTGTVGDRLHRIQRAIRANHPALGSVTVLTEREALRATESTRIGDRGAEFDLFILNPKLAEAIISWGTEPFEWPPLPEYPGFIRESDLGCACCGDLYARESPCRYCIKDQEES